MKKAVVLLSGGLDSATTAAIARDRGFALVAMTFNYGQRHDVEIASARRLAAFFNVTEHVFIDVPAEIFSTALLKDSPLEVPPGKTSGSENDIPVTYVPARNILFLSYALALAESRGISDIYIGANAVDYSGYPDCRPEFFSAFREMARQGTRHGVTGHEFTIATPLIDLKKSEIIRIGTDLGLDYTMTHSCYNPDSEGRACGVCDSCCIRRAGFNEAGIADPTRYSDDG